MFLSENVDACVRSEEEQEGLSNSEGVVLVSIPDAVVGSKRKSC